MKIKQRIKRMSEAEVLEWFSKVWPYVGARAGRSAADGTMIRVLMAARCIAWEHVRACGPEGTADWWWSSRPEIDPSPYKKARIVQANLWSFAG